VGIQIAIQVCINPPRYTWVCVMSLALVFQQQTLRQLPNELLSVIINELASDTDIRTLAALASCRLASYVLCSLATPFLFSSIELGPEVNRSLKERVTKLNELLTIHDIAASVHTLTLRCEKADLVDGTLIPEILHRLPCI
jgi:hypothetical protein